ncbi:MAG: hypothetical protein PHP43_09990, partial [Methanoculleus sp.]|nr:hypothetical protein [Methanoculleus sp.]
VYKYSHTEDEDGDEVSRSREAIRMADEAYCQNLLSRPELLPANDAIRNGILFGGVASHPVSNCWRCYHDCPGPGFDRCGNCSLRCRPYRRLTKGGS